MFQYVVLIAGEWSHPGLVLAESPEAAARAYSRWRPPSPGDRLLVWSGRDYSLLPEERPSPRILSAE